MDVRNPNEKRADSFARARGALVALATLAVLAVATPAWSDKTYYLDESTDFTGNGCENADLNDVTSSLRGALDGNGWTGQRWTNANAWPQDYIESTMAGLSGVDNLFGDNFLLTVYAGHGNRALIQFGTKRNNRCTVNLETQARLGLQGGNKAVYVMYATSCTLNLDSLSRNFNHEVRRTVRVSQFAFDQGRPAARLLQRHRRQDQRACVDR